MCWSNNRFLLLVTLFVLAVTATSLDPTTARSQITLLDEWSRGVGEGAFAKLAFKFEVTFMKIDVADIEARVAPATAAALSDLVQEGRLDKESRNEAANLLLAADTVAFRFVFLRDGGLDRFLDGTRQNLEAGRNAGLLSSWEYTTIWDGFQRTMVPLNERGALAGDQLLYRVEPGKVRIMYLGVDGDPLIDTFHAGDFWARGIKGSFFSSGSRFRDELIRSLELD